ncbi:MAG TPA: DeoR/GlpR family DNA-binding transcription regulator [Microbacterium sp.]|nr:DeoR/GlpR family DNA-binding transcription regulator [Microbacterium sp.]
MLTVQRKQHLIELLARERRVVAKEVALALGVSEDSIRRDLRELAAAGECVRVYGGAVPIDAVERPVGQRHDIATASKNRVARSAVGHIRAGSTVMLDAGTTTLAMARMLPNGSGLTVVTPSPAVALAAAENSDARVLMIGGELTRHSMVAGGALALEAIQHLASDMFFMGATGIDPVHGLTCASLDDAVTKRALAARSADVFVLGSEEKIGGAWPVPVLGLDRISGVIVDPEDRNPLIARLPQA